MSNLTTIFDNSMLEAFRVCPRRFYWQYVRNLVLDEPRIAMNAGTILHAGLEKFYSPASQVESPESLYSTLFNSTESTENIPTQYTLPNLQTVLTNYTNVHQNEPFKVLHTELGFAIPLAPSEPILYSGRIDLVTSWPPFGIVIIDHKTTSRWGYTNQQMTYPNAQLCGYVWGYSHFTPEKLSACLNWIHILAKTFNFHRTMPVQYTPFDIQNWHQSTIQTIKQVHQAEANSNWAMHMNMCYKFYGQCPYITLCMIQKPLSQINPPASYVENLWEPFEGLKSE